MFRREDRSAALNSSDTVSPHLDHHIVMQEGPSDRRKRGHL